MRLGAGFLVIEVRGNSRTSADARRSTDVSWSEDNEVDPLVDGDAYFAERSEAGVARGRPCSRNLRTSNRNDCAGLRKCPWNDCASPCMLRSRTSRPRLLIARYRVAKLVGGVKWALEDSSPSRVRPCWVHGSRPSASGAEVAAPRLRRRDRHPPFAQWQGSRSRPVPGTLLTADLSGIRRQRPVRR